MRDLWPGKTSLDTGSVFYYTWQQTIMSQYCRNTLHNSSEAFTSQLLLIISDSVINQRDQRFGGLGEGGKLI